MAIMARAAFKIPELLADISGQKECKKVATKLLIAILALPQIDCKNEKNTATE